MKPSVWICVFYLQEIVGPQYYILLFMLNNVLFFVTASSFRKGVRMNNYIQWRIWHDELGGTITQHLIAATNSSLIHTV